MSSIAESKASTSSSVTSPANIHSSVLQTPAFTSSSISILSSTSRRSKRSFSLPNRHVTAKYASCDSLVASSSSTRLPPIHEPRQLDWKLELARNSSTTLLPSRSVSPTISTFWSCDDLQHASTQSDAQSACDQSRRHFVYPLHQPGERIAKRTRLLRSRIETIIQSLPATVDDTVDVQASSPLMPEQWHDVPSASRSSSDSCKKLRRVPGCSNLRANFRQSISLQRDDLDNRSSAQVVRRVFTSPCPRPRSPALSSVDTLVETSVPSIPTEQEKPKDKVVCSTISYFPTTSSERSSLIPSPLPSGRDHRPGEEAQPLLPSSPSYYRRGPRERSSQREACDEFGHVYAGDPVWSCAKISRSAAKRAARRVTPSKMNGLRPYSSIFTHSLSK